MTKQILQIKHIIFSIWSAYETSLGKDIGADFLAYKEKYPQLISQAKATGYNPRNFVAIIKHIIFIVFLYPQNNTWRQKEALDDIEKLSIKILDKVVYFMNQYCHYCSILQ